jgi:uncharacterized membrane protein YgcG
VAAARAPLFGLLLAMAAAAGTARAGIDDLKGTKPGELQAGGKFVSADGCAQCHGGGWMGDTGYLPSDTWAGTMMANAARDPVFLAALAVANQDAPGVGTFCIRCHTPIAFVRGHATPPDASALDDVDRQGVGCEVCHRAAPSGGPDAPYFLGDAQLVFTDDTAKRGPYDGAASPSHASQKDPSLADARFCGQCHQVTNPDRNLRDAAGADMGVAFPLDTTYEEWEASDFAEAGSSFKSCIDCHMQRKLGALPVATPQGAPLRQNPRDHALTGGNHWGIQAVMKAAPERAAAFAGAFENALARTLDTLRAAVKVSIVASPEASLPGQAFDVTVRVENLTGHKFPAGYAESRRAWVALSLVDDEGTERTLVGAYDAATGAIAEAPKTRIYKAVHGRFAGGASEPEEHIALHDRVISDTRIPPKGFTPSITTMPASDGDIDFSDGSGGFRSYDEATFTVAPPAALSGAQTLSARVYYQSMTREYVEFLREENTTNSAGEALHAIYEETGSAPPILVASADAPIVIGEAAGAGGSGGGGSTGSAAGAGGAAGGGDPGGAGGSQDPGGGCDCGVIAIPERASGLAPHAAALLCALALAGRRLSQLLRRA